MENIIGNIYEGQVVYVDNNEYLVDINVGFDTTLLKSEATKPLKVNDVIEVIATHYNKDQYFVSMKGVEKRNTIDHLTQAIETQELVKGLVKSYKNNRFTVELDNGVLGSVYVRNMSTRFVSEPTPYLNKTLDFVVVSRNNRGYEDFELNHRLVEEKVNQKKLELLNDIIKVGEVYDAIVTNQNKAGIILDVLGYECFVPFSEISHTKKATPENGAKFKVYIKEINENNLSLKGSIKKNLSHPFTQMEEVKVNDILKGKVTKIVDFGLFVEVKEDVEGLVHISEISYKHTREITGYEVGQEVEVKVIGIDHKKHKLSLSIKRLVPSPFEVLKEEIKVDDHVQVQIKKIMENGIRVKVANDYFQTIINEDIHDFSRLKPTFKINDYLDTLCVEVDEENEKFVLSNEAYVSKQYEIFEASL